MGVYLGGHDTAVAEHLLYEPYVGASLYELGGESVTQGMRAYRFGYAGIGGRPFHYVEDHYAAERSAVSAEEQIVGITALYPHGGAYFTVYGYLLYQFVGYGHEAFFVAFAYDAQISVVEEQVCYA